MSHIYLVPSLDFRGSGIVTPDPTLHWRADQISGTANNYTLLDLTGNGHDAVQSAGTSTQSVESGVEKLELTGARFDSPLTVPTQWGTMICVLKRRTGTETTESGIFGHGGTGSGDGYGFNRVWDGWENSSPTDRRFLYSGAGLNNTSGGSQQDFDVTDINTRTMYGYMHGRGMRVHTKNNLILNTRSDSINYIPSTKPRSDVSITPSLGTDYRGATYDFYELIYFADRVWAPWLLDSYVADFNTRYGTSFVLWSSYEERDVWMHGGQSNEVSSRGYISSLNAEYDQVQPNSLIFNGTETFGGYEVEPMDPTESGGTGNLATQASGQSSGGLHGKEIALARDYVALSQRKTATYKYATGGTWVVENPTGSNPNGSWHPEHLGTGPKFCLHARGYWQFLQKMQDLGLRPNIKGFVWHQGEQESTDATDAPLFEAATQLFFDEVEKYTFGVSNPPIYLCRLHSTIPAGDAPELATIRTAQANLAANNSNVTLIDTDGASTFTGDLWHLDTDGLQTVVDRILGASNPSDIWTPYNEDNRIWIDGTAPYFETELVGGKYALRNHASLRDSVRAPEPGACIEFTGTEYGRCASQTINAFPFVLHAKFYVSSNGCAVLCIHQAAGAYFQIVVNGSGDLVVNRRNIADISTTIAASVTKNTWHDVTVCFDSATQFRACFNGTTTTYSGLTSVDLTGFTAGQQDILAGLTRLSPAGSFFDGFLRDLRVYDATKSDSEMEAIQAEGEGDAPDITNMYAGYWCNERKGNTLYDYSGNGRDATIINFVEATNRVTDSGVTLNPANYLGHTNDNGTIKPRNEDDISQDIDDVDLEFTGRCPYPPVIKTPCFSPDTATCYINCGNDPKLTDLDDGFTLSAVVKFNSFTSDPGVCGYGEGGTSLAALVSYYLSCNSSGVLGFALSDGTVSTPTFLSSGHTLSISQWYRIDVTWDGTTNANGLKFYVDGVLVGQATSPVSSLNTSPTNVDFFKVGARRNSGSGLLDGSVAWVGLRDTALSASEILALYDSSESGAPDNSSIVLDLPLQEGPGSSNTNRTVYDRSSNSLDGTVVGGTVSAHWGTLCPGYVKDLCYEAGGSIGSLGEFVPPSLDGTTAADGNALTFTGGTHDNPFSDIDLNPYDAAENNGRTLPDNIAPGDDINGTATPTDSGFINADGNKIVVTKTTKVTSALSKLENYTS